MQKYAGRRFGGKIARIDVVEDAEMGLVRRAIDIALQQFSKSEPAVSTHNFRCSKTISVYLSMGACTTTPGPFHFSR